MRNLSDPNSDEIKLYSKKVKIFSEDEDDYDKFVRQVKDNIKEIINKVECLKI